MTGRGTSVAATIGFMLGMLVMAFLSHGGFRRHHHPDPERALRKFTREFSLRPDQQTTVLKILQDNAQKLDALHQDARTKLADLRKSCRTQLRAALDPDQQKLFDEKAARWDAKEKKD